MEKNFEAGQVLIGHFSKISKKNTYDHRTLFVSIKKTDEK
jgi:hypothetical protein